MQACSRRTGARIQHVQFSARENCEAVAPIPPPAGRQGDTIRVEGQSVAPGDPGLCSINATLALSSVCKTGFPLDVF